MWTPCVRGQGQEDPARPHGARPCIKTGKHLLLLPHTPTGSLGTSPCTLQCGQGASRSSSIGGIQKGQSTWGSSRRASGRGLRGSGSEGLNACQGFQCSSNANKKWPGHPLFSLSLPFTSPPFEASCQLHIHVVLIKHLLCARLCCKHWRIQQ